MKFDCVLNLLEVSKIVVFCNFIMKRVRIDEENPGMKPTRNTSRVSLDTLDETLRVFHMAMNILKI